MTNVEKSIFDFIEKHLVLLFIIVVTVFGIAIRLCCLDFESRDYTSYLIKWWNIFADNGKHMLQEQVGNYNIPYQIIIYIFTLCKFEPLIAYKTLSIIFDFVLAVSTSLVFYTYSQNASKFLTSIVYALVVFSIPVILNSSCWAQCDSIYVSFIMLALIFIKKDKNFLSFLMLGIAFAFKFQTIFIFPVFIYYYITTKKISIFHYIIILVVDFLMCLPAVMLGRSPLSFIRIYFNQSYKYRRFIQLNFPNLWALLLDGTNKKICLMFYGFALIFAIFMIGIGAILIMKSRANLCESNNFLITAIWTTFTCLMFLPTMHERYAYMLDIIALVYCVINIKRLCLFFALTIISLRGYCFYLFAYDFLSIQKTALIYIVIYIYVSYIFINDVLINGKKLANNDNAIKINHIAKKKIKKT